MTHRIVHAEIIGPEPGRLRTFYRDLFGWDSDTDAAVAPEVSTPGEYGFIALGPGDCAAGIGGGPGFTAHTVFYVGVDDVDAMLERAEQLGGTRRLGPATRPDGALVIAHFADPAGNVVGLAGPA